jgi:hypothetical protein
MTTKTQFLGAPISRLALLNLELRVNKKKKEKNRQSGDWRSQANPTAIQLEFTFAEIRRGIDSDGAQIRVAIRYGRRIS